jgi:AraC family transcriptional regulator
MADFSKRVVFLPAAIAKRQSLILPGIVAETVQVTPRQRFEYRLHAPVHLLIASHRAERRDGETYIEGLPRSARREFNRKLTIVPAGSEFHGWQDPSAPTRATYFYIDPNGPPGAADLRFAEVDLMPRLFFEDAALWETAAKLAGEIERGAQDRFYAEALGLVLLTELARLQRGAASREPIVSGGLAAWQRRAIEEHIEAHLGENLSLLALADMAKLSPRHFSRSFKQSFGLPPHHFHLVRRIERAKVLLTNAEMTVTEIAMALGFADTSAFSTAFRRIAGGTPRDYRRALT